MKSEERARRVSFTLLAMDVWWPYHDSVFASSARRLLLCGKVLFPVIVVTYVVSFVQLRGG